jgi:uncharacterized protein (DUF1697 family)
MSNIYIALLRGINVGGKNKLAMRDLVRMFANNGCREVRTFIQSGNVIFRTEAEVVDLLPDRISQEITKSCKYRTSLILRSEAELESVVCNNPFLERGLPEDNLHVLFLADMPRPSAVNLLDPDRSPPDEFVVRQKEIYLKLPNGAGRTRLTNAYFDLRLATTSTGRNWRTITKLLQLAKGV